MNLRKAKQVQDKISETINNLRFPEHRVDAMTVESWQSECLHRLKEYDDMLKEANDLSRVAYNIRKLQGNANASSGINEILTELAFINRHIDTLDNVLRDIAEQEPKEVVQKRVEIKNNELLKSERSFGFDAAVKVSIFTKDYIHEKEAEMRQLKKERVKLDDKLLDLNISTNIELDDADMDLLVKYDII